MNDEGAALRVLVADGSPEFRDAISGWLASHPRVAEVRVAGRGGEVERMAAAGAIDLVLLDAVLPPDGGFALARRLTVVPAPPLVVLLVLYDYAAVRREALSCGAVAALDKSALLPRLGPFLDGLRVPRDRRGSRSEPAPRRPGFPGVP